jgi:hypothetical protein
MQLDYEPPKSARRISLELVIVRFCAGMALGALLFCTAVWDFNGLVCFPFYAVVPLLTFSTSLFIHARPLHAQIIERHMLFTIGVGAASLAAEFLAAWIDGKCTFDAEWDYVMWGTILTLPIACGWFSLQRSRA